MPKLVLAAGKERSILRHHPWVFAGSVERFEGRARPGDTVELVSARGEPLARAAWSPHSKIRARVWSFDPNETIDDAFFKRRVAAAVARRQGLPGLRGQHALRLVNGESDGLPGVIADRYGDTAVLQLSSAGAEAWRDALATALQRVTGCARIYERSDTEVRGLEGLEPCTGWLRGDPAESPLVIDEHGLLMEVDFVSGHKTGCYLDQRDNRRLCRELSSGRDVLDCFCYTGGFSLNALAGGSRSVLSIDSSATALESVRRNLQLNAQLAQGRIEWRQANVFEALRELKRTERRFDLIVLDPPKLAPSAAHAERAARAYKDINLFGLRLLNSGGLLMTFSCSGGVGPELFQKIVAGAAIDAAVDARIIGRLGASPDHPFCLSFPEGEYLKGLLCQVG